MDACKCGKSPLKGDKYCRICGDKIVSLSDSFLCECGAEVEKEDQFCHACGVKFDGIEEEDEFLNNTKCKTCGSFF